MELDTILLKKNWYSKDFFEQKSLFIDKNGMLVNNVNWLDKTVRLPDGDDIGYKLFLLTEIWAKLYSSIGVMSGENGSFMVFSLL